MAMVPGILVNIETGQSIRELKLIKSWRDFWQSTVKEYKETECLIEEMAAREHKDKGKEEEYANKSSSKRVKKEI